MDGAWAAILGAIVGGTLTAATTAGFSWWRRREQTRAAARITLAEVLRCRVLIDDALAHDRWWSPLNMKIGVDLLGPLAGGLSDDDWVRLVSVLTTIHVVESNRASRSLAAMSPEELEMHRGVPEALLVVEPGLRKLARLKARTPPTSTPRAG